MNTNILIYRHLKPCGEVFYVGIGDKKRPYSKSNRSKFWKDTVNKYGYFIEILYNNLTWEDACELESFLIKLYGRKDLKTGSLVNLTDGGEGTLNHKVTEEHKLKLKILKLGKKDSEITKLKKSKYSKNRTKSHTENILNKIKKPVLQFSLNGEFIKKWDSLLSAETNNYGYIRGCLNGKQKTAGGYFWIYEKSWQKMKAKIDKGDYTSETINGYTYKYINI
jgi:hypothetical protein